MRAFIIGNGPSLNPSDLDLLVEEECFAMNRINLIFDKTIWRPTHYVRAETPSVRWKKDDIREDLRRIVGLAGTKCYLRSTYKVHWDNLRAELDRVRPSTVEYFNRCKHAGLHFDDKDAPKEWHLPEICTFGTSLHTAIQIAVLEGFTRLYLLGCDMGYEDGVPNHFDPHYEKGFERHYQSAKYANGDALECHRIAQRSSSVRIFDCTPRKGRRDYIHKNIELEKVIR